MFGRLVVAGAQLGIFQLWPQGATEKNIFVVDPKTATSGHSGVFR